MIRKITNDDLTSVMTIWVKGNFKGNSFIEKDYWLEIYNETKEKFMDIYDTYVFVEENVIKGFVSIKDKKIKAIYVNPSFIRNGIGKKLINFCKDKYDTLILEVYEKNINAILFFSNLGFKNKKIDIEKVHNEKIFIMEWNLEEKGI
mgnify:FL=1